MYGCKRKLTSNVFRWSVHVSLGSVAFRWKLLSSTLIVANYCLLCCMRRVFLAYIILTNGWNPSVRSHSWKTNILNSVFISVAVCFTLFFGMIVNFANGWLRERQNLEEKKKPFTSIKNHVVSSYHFVAEANNCISICRGIWIEKHHPPYLNL